MEIAGIHFSKKGTRKQVFRQIVTILKADGRLNRTVNQTYLSFEDAGLTLTSEQIEDIIVDVYNSMARPEIVSNHPVISEFDIHNCRTFNALVKLTCIAINSYRNPMKSQQKTEMLDPDNWKRGYKASDQRIGRRKHYQTQPS